jgi:hypothetical protein
MIAGMSGSVFVTRSSGMPTASVSTTTCNTMDTTFDPGARFRSGRSSVPVIKSNMIVGAFAGKSRNRHAVADHQLSLQIGQETKTRPGCQRRWVKDAAQRQSLDKVRYDGQGNTLAYSSRGRVHGENW